MSEDAARRAFQKVEEKEARLWQQRHLQKTYEPLLYEPYILDLDTTVKPLYGHQQGGKSPYALWAMSRTGLQTAGSG